MKAPASKFIGKVKMDIKKIDKNFATTFVAPEDLEWFSAQEFPFSVHGVTYSESDGVYRRLPQEVAEATNEGVAFLAKDTAGGRVRFATNSPYIAVRVIEPFSTPFSHMTIAGKNGVVIFTDGKFCGTVMPAYEEVASVDESRGGTGIIEFDGIKYPPDVSENVYQVEIFLPLYSAVKSIHIGLKKGCLLQEAKPYKHTEPVVFYGSSITQGGCACKPGDDYVNRLCRLLDTEILNLGFSGSARGELVMADYIVGQNPAVFVMDYDHNAPDAEHLKNTHFAFYERVRKACPTMPIVMMTMPTIETYETRAWNQPRKAVIEESYRRAKANGDTNVYLVDCYGCFGAYEDGECGTVDDCHPNSLGFLRMAERVYPILNQLLNGKTNG